MGKSRKLLMVTLTFVCALGVMLAPSKVVKAGGATVTLEVSSGEDITAELKKAVNDTSNERVIIPSGSYTLGRCEIIRSNVTIEAKGATLNVREASAPRMLFTSEGSLTGITVDGGTWNNTGSTGAAIRFCHSGTASIKNAKIIGSVGSAIELFNSKQVILNNVSVTGANRGFDFENIKDVNVNKIKATKCSGEGIRLEGVRKFLVNNSESSNNGKNGIRVIRYAYGTDNTAYIKNSIVNSNGINGICLEMTGGVTLENTVVKSNKNYGMVLYGSNVAEQIAVTANDCSIQSNKKDGVRIASENCKTVGLLNNCNCSYNGENGVIVTGKNGKAVIAGGNYCNNGPTNLTESTHDTKGAGIDIIEGATAEINHANISNNKSCGVSVFLSKNSQTDCANISIIGCTIKNNFRHGIAAECQYKKENGTKKALGKKVITNMIIRKCNISSNKYHGIMLMVNTTAKSVANNTITGNAQNGIYLSQSTIIKSEGNKVNNNKLYGYNLADSKATLNKETVQANKKNGIYEVKSTVSISNSNIKKNMLFGIKGEMGTLKVSKCMISNNRSAGIRGENKVKLTLTENTVASNNEGISIQKKASAMKVDNNVIKNNKNRGILVDASTVKSMQKNKVTGHKTRGIYITNKAVVTGLKNNSLCNQTSAKEIKVDNGAKCKKIAAEVYPCVYTLKKNSKTIQGTTNPNTKIKATIKHGSQTSEYSTKTNIYGAFKMKIKKLKTKSNVKIYYIDKNGNCIYRIQKL